MSEIERAKVGRALDLLRDSLYEYVDTAMVNAYGPQWDERVADENAKHRPNGRRWPVSKRDLAVILKVIQHEKIAPWWNSETRVDPRVRSFASELLTLRNLFSHGDQCVNEHARLLDTASRLLQLLRISVPAGLDASADSTERDASDREAAALIDRSVLEGDLYDREVASLGERGKRLSDMFKRATALFADFTRNTDFATVPRMGEAEADLVQLRQETFLASTGEEAFLLLKEASRLEANVEYDSSSERVLILLVRHFILDTELLLLAIAFHVHLLVENSRTSEPELRTEQVRAAARSSGLLQKWSKEDSIMRARELVEAAHESGEGSAIANSAIILGNEALLRDPTLESDEAVRLLRDSSARARMLAAMNPGTYYETWVVTYLRREGKLCNDLGRSDEATQAFARAAGDHRSLSRGRSRPRQLNYRSSRVTRRPSSERDDGGDFDVANRLGGSCERAAHVEGPHRPGICNF